MPVVNTTCPYCGVGCGVRATPTGAQSADIAGDPTHPANLGRLCVKGSALGETLGLQGRLLQPELRGIAGYAPVTWSRALDEVAHGLQRIIEAHGPDAVALYVSGQLLTEDYYVANKLMKGYVGSANIDTNSRLCMSSAVAGHRRAFGEDVVPVSYADIDHASLLVLVGSNTAWCHPVLHQRMLAARERAQPLQIVVVDPRRTPTCDDAELHLPVRPGTDVALFNGLLSWLHEHGHTDIAFVREHTAGCAAALAVARQTSGSLGHVARECGVQVQALEHFYRLFASHERVITAFSQGVNQSSAGTDKVNSIINCHLLSGRIGKPGCGPFSITGQPNAMGGREVGGLANQLAAHLELGQPAHRALVQDFWHSPNMASKPGLKAVELFEAIHAGKVRAVWIMGTNPVVSLPDADRVRTALARCELVVVSEVVRNTDTSRHAHIRLPALAWGEKDGTVTNSERCISRQRAFLPAPGEARADWWALCEVAQRMGYGAGFRFAHAHQIFNEHARLSATNQTAVSRQFNLTGLCALDERAYDALLPMRWPVLRDPRDQNALQGHSLRADRVELEPFSDGRFSHPDGRARLLAVWPRRPVHAADDDYPLLLNTGRVRDHWHTMTRTGRAPRLAGHRSIPELEVHPQDALLHGIRDGALTRLTSRWGSAVLRARVNPDQARRQLFAPIHWNDQTASDATIGRVVNPVVDPVSGEPEFKHTPVRVEPFAVDWSGFVLLRQQPDVEPAAGADNSTGAADTADLHVAAMLGAQWWTRVTVRGGSLLHIAGRGRRSAPEWSERTRSWRRENSRSEPSAHVVCSTDEEWLEASDDAQDWFRAVHLSAATAHIHAVLLAAVFVAPTQDELPSPDWLARQLRPDDDQTNVHASRDADASPDADANTDTVVDRIAWLMGGQHAARVDNGNTVCACFAVGERTILAAIAEAQQAGQPCSTADLGARLRCGTNCGSCLPELRRMIARAHD